MEDYVDRQVQLWKIIQTYSDIPEKIADTHTHYEQLKTTLQTDFNFLKQATAKNNHNLIMNLTLQQAYTSTLGAHIKNTYTKIGKLQSQIQQHCMYAHTPENNHSDTVNHWHLNLTQTSMVKNNLPQHQTY